jgi:hypothetical protein
MARVTRAVFVALIRKHRGVNAKVKREALRMANLPPEAWYQRWPEIAIELTAAVVEVYGPSA